jgi:hypothetical protein
MYYFAIPLMHSSFADYVSDVQYKALQVLGNLFGGFLECRVNYLPFFIFIFNLLPYHRRLPEATLGQLISLCSNLFVLFDGFSLSHSVSPTKHSNNTNLRSLAMNCEDDSEELDLAAYERERASEIHNAPNTDASPTTYNSASNAQASSRISRAYPQNNNANTDFARERVKHVSHGRYAEDEDASMRIVVSIREPASASDSPGTQSTPNSTASTATSTTDS